MLGGTREPAPCSHRCTAPSPRPAAQWCLPTGAYDPRKHASYLDCARAELSEEANLAGGAWEPLVPEEHPGIAEVKWCRWGDGWGAGAALV